MKRCWERVSFRPGEGPGRTSEETCLSEAACQADVSCNSETPFAAGTPGQGQAVEPGQAGACRRIGDPSGTYGNATRGAWLGVLLQLADSSFPSGAWGHSGGLEYAIQTGWVKTGEDLADWLSGALSSSARGLDLRAAASAWIAVRSVLDRAENQDPALLPGSAGTTQPGMAAGTGLAAGDSGSAGGDAYPFRVALARLDGLNADLAAFRPGMDQREAQAQLGRSFARSWVQAFSPPPGVFLSWLMEGRDPDFVQFPLAWGVITALMEIPLEAAIEALVQTLVRQGIQVAIRIIPLGQHEAFRIQVELVRRLGESVHSCDWHAECTKDLEGFSPGLDIAGLGHGNLARRYFRS